MKVTATNKMPGFVHFLDIWWERHFLLVTSSHQPPNYRWGGGGGINGTVWFELLACYQQNFYIFLGVWLFQNFLSAKQSDPNMVKSLFKNILGNSFFEAPFYETKRSNFFLNIDNIGLCVKNAFGNNFGPQEVPKLENLHFHFHGFSGWGTSWGPKLFP